MGYKSTINEQVKPKLQAAIAKAVSGGGSKKDVATILDTHFYPKTGMYCMEIVISLTEGSVVATDMIKEVILIELKKVENVVKAAVLLEEVVKAVRTGTAAPAVATVEEEEEEEDPGASRNNSGD